MENKNPTAKLFEDVMGPPSKLPSLMDIAKIVVWRRNELIKAIVWSIWTTGSMFLLFTLLWRSIEQGAPPEGGLLWFIILAMLLGSLPTRPQSN